MIMLAFGSWDFADIFHEEALYIDVGKLPSSQTDAMNVIGNECHGSRNLIYSLVSLFELK